jgi:hypothetical protein
MKTFKLITAGILLLFSTMAIAQVSVNVNVGSPPAWGPVGYTEVEYYYLPDVEVYYDVHATQFIFYRDGRWVRSRYMPRQYRNYDLYNGYKVVLNDYHGATPYVYFNDHKVKYYKGYKNGHQQTIGVKHKKHKGGKGRR